MSETASGAEAGSGEEAEAAPARDDDSAEAHAYFQRLETAFLELRGSPLTLGSADWHLSREWFREGIPLELVERVLREVFERRRKRGTERKVLSLRFCKRAVKEAWQSHRELQAGGERGEIESFDPAGRLERLAGSLPEALAGGAELARRITALEGAPEVVEEALAKLDAELLERAEAALTDAERSELEQALEAALAGLGSRLPAAELERARARLREQLLRERTGLPVLSLFGGET